MKVATQQIKKWLPMGALVAMLGAGIGGAQAATCEVLLDSTNPDASLTSATACGPGTLDSNDNSTNVDIAEPSTRDWGLAAKAGDETVSSPGTSLTITGTTSGQWFIDTTLPSASTDFMLVMKDGNVDQLTPSWFWFIIEEVACGTAPYEFCGTWSMYGENGRIKNISHMSLYVSNSNGTEPPIDIPEPGSLALLGVALSGLAASRRKLLKGAAASV